LEEQVRFVSVAFFAGCLEIIENSQSALRPWTDVVSLQFHIMTLLTAFAIDAGGIAYLTAYESLVITGGIEQHRGKWIYVAGAAGGVGHFASQITKLYGLKVIGSAGSAASLDLLEKLELDHVIDYSKQNHGQPLMNWCR
jgi:NADPH-dependent curcumin reductase CurA